MTTRTSRTISVLEGDWERWKEAAWQRRIPSVSEYIRKAVEAYEHGDTSATERAAALLAPPTQHKEDGASLARYADSIAIAAIRAQPPEPILSPEEAKERVEAVVRDTAGLILPVGYTGADASELIFGPTERMTPTPPRGLALPPLAPYIAAEHERVAEARRRQPITKESQTKRRGKR